jgi:hypothetical protein
MLLNKSKMQLNTTLGKQKSSFIEQLLSCSIEIILVGERMENKEVIKIVVTRKNSNLTASIKIDSKDDYIANLSFAFIAFCEEVEMTPKETLKYLKQNLKLWEENGGFEIEHINS